MRKAVVLTCLFAFVLTGCASRPVELVPAGVDRNELLASIARRGEYCPVEPGEPETDPVRPKTTADKVFEVASCSAYYVAVGVVVCAIVAPVIAFYILVPGPKPSFPALNLGGSGSSN